MDYLYLCLFLLSPFSNLSFSVKDPSSFQDISSLHPAADKVRAAQHLSDIL